MNARPRRLVVALGLATECVVAGCNSSNSTMPGLGPWKVHGQNAATVAGLPIKVGQSMDFDAYLFNSTGHPVQVIAARPSVLPGHPGPSLMHIGLEHTRNIVGVQAGWPPSDVGATPLLGNSLPPGVDKIAVGIGKDKAGTYVATGVILTVKDNGTVGTTTAWGGAYACVYRTKAQHEHCANVIHHNPYVDLLLDYFRSK